MSWKHYHAKLSPEELSARNRKAGLAAKGKAKSTRGQKRGTNPKISAAKMGKPSGMLGKHHTETTKEKQSLIHKGMPGKIPSQATRDKISANHVGMRGKHHTQVTKDKLRNTRNAQIAAMSPEEYAQSFGKFSQAGSTALFSKHTSKPENLFGALLEAQGIAYVKSTKPILAHSRSYWPDFILENMLIIEFFGCYIHQCEECGHKNGYYVKRLKRHGSAEEIRAYDAQRKADLESLGYTVQIVWEHELPGLLEKYTL